MNVHPASATWLLSLALTGVALSASAEAPDFSPYGSGPAAISSYSLPQDSARPGQTFFYQAMRANARDQNRYAVDLYRTSASWAYKPAQYNLGVMYFKGEGVPVDRPLGMAWLALAAERGDRDFERSRDAAYADMTAEEFERANVLWRDLKKTFGDEAALQRARNRWLQVRTAATGSHLGRNLGNMRVGSRGIGRQSDTQASSGILAGDSVDGSLAYRQLVETDTPYDPKSRQSTGNARVLDLVPVGDGAPPATTPDPTPRFY